MVSDASQPEVAKLGDPHPLLRPRLTKGLCPASHGGHSEDAVSRAEEGPASGRRGAAASPEAVGRGEDPARVQEAPAADVLPVVLDADLPRPGLHGGLLPAHHARGLQAVPAGCSEGEGGLRALPLLSAGLWARRGPARGEAGPSGAPGLRVPGAGLPRPRFVSAGCAWRCCEHGVPGAAVYDLKTDRGAELGAPPTESQETDAPKLEVGRKFKKWALPP